MMRVHDTAYIIKTTFYSICPQDKVIWTLREKEIWRYLYSFIKYIKKKDWANNSKLERFFSIVQEIFCYKMYVFELIHLKQDFNEFFDNFLYYLFKKFFDLFLCIYYRYYSHDDITFINNLTDYFELIINIAKEYYYVIDYTANPSNKITGSIPDEKEYLNLSEECFSNIEFSFKDDNLYYKLNFKSEEYQFPLKINSKQVIKEKAYKYFFFRKVLNQFYDENSLLNVLEGLGKSFMDETKKALKYV